MAGGKPKKTPLLLSLGRAFPQKTRDELYALILCGEVRVDGAVCRDPKAAVRPQGTLDIAEKTGVSRGTVKLAGALEALGLEVAGLRVLDAGASTGGFTRRLLDRGAAMVYAVDVGYNQLDYPLRRDPRVRVMERTNIMQVSSLEPPPDLAVSDLSFRSIVGAAPHILSLCRGNLLLALIKPQFEYRNAPRDFTGVVRSPEAYREILEGVAARLLMRDLGIAAGVPSPLTGRRGNREFFFLLYNRQLPRYSFWGERFPGPDPSPGALIDALLSVENQENLTPDSSTTEEANHGPDRQEENS